MSQFKHGGNDIDAFAGAPEDLDRELEELAIEDVEDNSDSDEEADGAREAADEVDIAAARAGQEVNVSAVAQKTAQLAVKKVHSSHSSYDIVAIHAHMPF